MKQTLPARAAHPRARSAVRTTLAASLVLTSAASFAQSERLESAPPALRFSGFGTIGVVHADAPQGWSYRRDIAQVGSSQSTRADVDSRLGLQLNYEATQEVEFVGQLILMRNSPYAETLDSVEWAFVAYRPLPEWALRVGRVNTDQFLMADYRNVGFAYPYVRPPVDFYGSTPQRLDGADLTRSWNIGEARWRWKGFIGRAQTGDLNYDGNTQIKASYGLSLSREAHGLQIRASLSRNTLGNLPAPAQALDNAMGTLVALPVPSIAGDAKLLRQRLDFANSAATYASLAASYEFDDWQLTGEAMRVRGRPFVSLDAAYASLARRFGPVTGFGSVSLVRGTASHVAMPNWAATLAPLLGNAVAQQAQYVGTAAADAVNMAAPNQHTFSLGARWDLHPQVALKMQFDRVFTSAFGGRLWANPTSSSASSSVTSVTLDFIF